MNPTTRSDSPTQAGTSKDDLIASTRDMIEQYDATERAQRNSARQIADNLATLRDRHDLAQADIGKAVGKTQGWVSQMLSWREADFPPEGPFAAAHRRAKKKILAANNRPAKRKAKASQATGNVLFDAAEAFYRSELEEADDATFDRVIGMLVEWRRASKAKASGQPNESRQAANSAVAIKIGKEPVKSLDGFSENAKRQIAVAVAGNGVDAEQSAADRKAANSNLAMPDDGSIPDFLRRTAA